MPRADTGFWADRFVMRVEETRLEAKVVWVQNANGCVWCRDWSGKHQNYNCPAGHRPCGVVGCGKKHMKLLHGSTNKFAGMIHVVESSFQV